MEIFILFTFVLLVLFAVWFKVSKPGLSKRPHGMDRVSAVSLTKPAADVTLLELLIEDHVVTYLITPGSAQEVMRQPVPETPDNNPAANEHKFIGQFTAELLKRKAGN